MEIIEGVALSELCDYSFGDQSGQWGQIYTSFMKDANLFNTEFASKVFDIKKERDYMTCLLYTSPSPRDLSTSRMPSSA